MTVTDNERFTQAWLAEEVATTLLAGRFRWSQGLGWLRWDNRRWANCPEETAIEEVRRWVRRMLGDATKALRTGQGEIDQVKAWHSVAKTASNLRAITGLAKGIDGVITEASAFDAHPDLLNTPGGVVDLRTGTVTAHAPHLLLTKITSGSFRPGFRHPDWEQALEAVRDDETRSYLQARLGQGATGHRSPDGVNVVMQGGGENGKGALGTDGVVPALGDYAELASHKLIADTNEHSEEMATLRGKRLIIAEELTENRALNVTAIKRISDNAMITARHVHQRNMTFRITHTLFATTNYIPVVNEVDRGIWRRLALVVFPFTFRKHQEPLATRNDRRGDPGLKKRIEDNVSGQHDAIVTWLVEGAMRWYRDDAAALEPSNWVTSCTDVWRANADRILGFWRARLITDPNACILADEMLAAFNDWLIESGHKQWSRELFAPRFGTHEETQKRGVESRRTVQLGGVSRWVQFASMPMKPLPKQATAWTGVRFRTPTEQGEPDPLAELAELPATFPRDFSRGEFGLDSASSAMPGIERHQAIDAWQSNVGSPGITLGNQSAGNGETYRPVFPGRPE